MSQAEYADPEDTAMLSIDAALLQSWADFETSALAGAAADPRQRFGSLINVGAGRRISENDYDFVSRFEQVYLLEPDEPRRTALLESLAATPQWAENVLADRIEALSPQELPNFDFVLCKYVLQHVRTDVLPTAVAKLRELVAPGGAIGVFSAWAEQSRFQVTIPVQAEAAVPSELRRLLQPNNQMLVADIDEATFNGLLSEPQSFPFITTHHIGRARLEGFFEGFEISSTDGPISETFVTARRI